MKNRTKARELNDETSETIRLYIEWEKTNKIVGFGVYCLNKGRIQALQEVQEMIDNNKIECTIIYGEWWINLNKLNSEIEKMKNDK